MPPALDLGQCLAGDWVAAPDLWLRALAAGGVLMLMSAVSTVRFFAGRPAFVWTLGAMALWLVASSVERASASAGCKSAVSLLAWVPILTLPVLWSLFVRQYVDSDPSPPDWGWRLANLVPLVVLAALAASNGAHGLLYGPGTHAGATVLGAPRMHYDRGPLFWLAAAWGYTLMLNSSVRIARAGLAAHGAARRQWAGFLFVSAVPMATNVAYVLLGWTVFGGDGTPLSFAAAAAGFAWLIRRDQLFQVVPMARRLLFTELPDAVLILDGEQRVMQANRAAQQLAGQSPPAGSALAEWPRFGAALAAHLAQGQAGTPLALADPPAWYDVRSREIGAGSRRIGVLVQLHDISDHQRAHASVVQRLAARDAELSQATATQAELREQALRDALTGLLNRRALDTHFAQRQADAGAPGLHLAFVLIDLDHFKRVNDEHGHAGGDAVLRDFGGALRQGLRASDAVYRVGGEEFALLLAGADAAQATRRVQMLREQVLSQRLGPLDGGITFSAGVATSDTPGWQPQALFQAADAALYAAKAQGRNCTVVAPALR